MDKKIFSNFLYNLLYQLLVIGTPIIITPYLARVLGVEQIGISSYVQTISSLFLSFGILGINLYGNKEIAKVRDNTELLSQTFLSIYVFQFISHLVVFILYLKVINYMDEEYKFLFLIQSVIIIGSTFNISWFMQGVENFKGLTIRNIFVKLFSLILIFTFVKEPKDIWIYLLVNVLSDLFGNIIMWRSLFKYIKVKFLKFNELKKHISNILLLFLPILFYQIYNLADRLIIEKFSGTTELGYYDQASKIFKISLTFVTAFNTVMLPRISNLFEKNDIKAIYQGITKTINITMFISLFITVLILGGTSNFVTWFFGETYLPVARLLLIISFIIIINPIGSIFTLQLGLAANNNKVFIFPYIVGAITSICLNIILIPQYGIIGAASTFLITEIIVCLIRLYYASKMVKLKGIFASVYKYIFAGVNTLILIYFIGSVLEINAFTTNLLQAIIGIVIYIFTLFLLKEENVLLIYYKIVGFLK